MTTHITVLGGLGFIGSHLCRALLAAGHHVRIFDKRYAARDLIRDIADRVEVVEGDIQHTPDVLNALKNTHTVLHLVHTTVPGSSMQDPAYDITSNITATAQWLARLPETSVRRIVYFSSGGTVYGVSGAALIDENHPTNPISAYGISKLALEKYVSMYAALYGLEHVILRPANVYGVGQKLHINQGIIGVFIDRALRGQPLEVWGTGTVKRDYLYIDDLAAAVLAVLGYAGDQRVFNVSNGVGCTVQDIIASLDRAVDAPFDVVYLPGRGFDVPSNVLDSSRLRAETGWQPSVTLEEGIQRTLAWVRSTQA